MWHVYDFIPVQKIAPLKVIKTNIRSSHEEKYIECIEVRNTAGVRKTAREKERQHIDR